MTFRAFISLCLLVVFSVLSTPAMARNAELLLSPTRVVLEGGSKFATVIVRNSGDGVGRYKVELADSVMDEKGGIRMLDEGVKDQFSAMDYISLSPRSLTLKPDESQNVRLLVKNMSDLPDGEYRSHLVVRMTENDLDLKTGQASADLEGAAVIMRPKMTTVIPIIIRKGQTSFTVTMDEAKLNTNVPEDKASAEVKATLSFSGNRSVLGDFRITHVAADGKEARLSFFQGLPIYRGVAKRSQVIRFKVPDGVNLRTGKIRVEYMSQENEGSQVLTSKEIVP